MKNYEIVKLLIKELSLDRNSKELPSILLSKYNTGSAGYYNFSHGIAEIH